MKVTISKVQWEEMGKKANWLNVAKEEDKVPKAEETKEAVKEKKKEWNPNPWAICNKNVDKKKEPAKFERCVMDVKKK